MKACEYCGHLYGSWHTCKGTQAADYNKAHAEMRQADRTSALAAVRTTDQSVELRAKVVLLETELNHVRTALEISQRALGHALDCNDRQAARLIENEAALTDMEAARDQAIHERDTARAVNP